MAARNIEVVIKVRDNASRKLDELKRKTRRAGKGAKKASLDFKDFNRTLFATTAFIGTFIKTYSTLARNLDIGAELDRVDNQFSRVLGPSSKMLSNVRQLTDATVDSMEAMRAGIALANSGITGSSEQTANIIAMSAAAARRAGLDTTEGIKRVVQFAKSGSVASLEFLNLVRSTDPAFTAQLELIKQAGGALGGTLSMQQKVAIGMRALEMAAKGNMKGQRDLQDVVKGVTDSFGIFRRVIGRFLGTALSPLLDKMTDFFYRMSTGLEELRKGSKEIMFLAKATVVTTGAVLGLAGALGTLRLATMALGSLGFGLPKLIMLTGILGSAFLGITDSADSLVDKLKLFGGFIQGIYQLITSFDEKTGLGNIDSSLKKLLKENKIFEFAKIIARGGILVKKTFEDMLGVVKGIALKIDDIFGGTFRSVIDAISEFNKPWDLALLNAENKWKRIAGIVTLIGGGFALKKILGSALSRVPIIGRLFGGGGKGPKGTANDPIFTVPVGKGLGGFFGMGKGKGKGASRLGKFFASMKNIARNGFKRLVSLSTLVLGKSFRFLTGTALGKLGLAAGAGVAIGTGINALADKYTTQENQYGQKSNAFERLMGKAHTFLPKSWGGISQDEYENMYDPFKNRFARNKAKFEAKQAGEKTSAVTVPKPDNTMNYLDTIGAQMQNVDKAESKKLQAATEQALKNGPEGAGVITEEEMNMLSNTFGRALDSSKVLKGIQENTDKGPLGPVGNRRPM